MEKDKKQQMLEDYLFNEYKDSGTPIDVIRRKYQGLNVDFTEVHRRRINYQIRTHGTQLPSSYSVRLKEIKKYNERNIKKVREQNGKEKK